MSQRDVPFTLPTPVLRVLQLLVAVGLAALAVGLRVAPQRTWAGFLLSSYFMLELSLAGVFLIAAHYVSGSNWLSALRRVPEAMAAILPVGAIGLLIVLLVYPKLYPWTTELAPPGTAVLAFKRLWLSRPFFLARAVLYLACWVGFATAIVRTSRRQDRNGDPMLTRRNVRLSAEFLAVLTVTLPLASFDWIMSLEPQWYSTIFFFYDFASMFLGGLAAVTILVIWVRRLAPDSFPITAGHLHDLGKLLFAFSIFWAYIWFCQYMLIWYGDIPEESSYFIERQRGSWAALFLLNLILNWAVPFLALMSQKAKQTARTLVVVAIVVLTGRVLDLYLAVLPQFAGSKPLIGVWEVGPVLGAVGLFALAFFSSLRRAPLVPLGDPGLAESLRR